MKKTNTASKPEKAKATKRLELVENTGGTDALVNTAMFRAGGGLDEGMTIKSRSPMLKPDKFPVGQLMTGIIKRLITCIVGQGDAGEDKAGCLVEIVPTLDTVGYAIPAVATISSALDITSTGKGKDAVFETPYLNHRVQLEKMAERSPSKKGQAAWVFLVAVSDKPVIV
jgi:hypothetical protein